MGLWLKSQKGPNKHPLYSSTQINALPTVVGVVVRISGIFALSIYWF